MRCQVGRARAVWNQQRTHASATCSQDAGFRVLECYTRCRDDPQTTGGLKIDVRRRLAGSHFVTGHDDLKTPVEPCVSQAERGILPLA